MVGENRLKNYIELVFWNEVGDSVIGLREKRKVVPRVMSSFGITCGFIFWRCYGIYC